jgi:hypothetical protein
MSEARETQSQPAARHGLARCGALGSDITRAVDVLSVQNGIPGSLAYRLLVQTATNAGLSLIETAGAIAHSSLPHDQPA